MIPTTVRAIRGSLATAWRDFRARLRAADPPRPPNESPLRAELLSAAQMERHGMLLARTHEIRHPPAPDRLLKRLAENESALVSTCNLLNAATAAGAAGCSALAIGNSGSSPRTVTRTALIIAPASV